MRTDSDVTFTALNTNTGWVGQVRKDSRLVSTTVEISAGGIPMEGGRYGTREAALDAARVRAAEFGWRPTTA